MRKRFCLLPALALAVLPAAAAVLADLGLFWKGRLLKKRG